MPSFPSSVNAPSTRDYGAPQVDFGILGNLYKTYQQSQLTEQQKKDNELILQKKQQDLAQQQQLRSLFANGLPMRDGQIDMMAVTQALAKAGDINAISQMAPLIQQQQAAAPTRFDSPGTPPQAPAKPPGDIPPISAVAGTRNTPTASPQGDASPGTVADVVAGKFGDAAPQTGPLIARVAAAMGVDPNQKLTLGQQRRAEGLLTRYGGDSGATGTPAPAPAAAPPGGPQPAPVTPNARVAAAFPPNAPAPTPVAPPPVAPGAPAATAPPSAPAAGATPPQQGQQQPIVPQEPLPAGYTDPNRAMLDLRAEARRLSSNPYAKEKAKSLNEWADRIQESQAPKTISEGQKIVSPTGKTLYSSPSKPVVVGGQLVRPDTGEVVFKPDSGSSATLDADAETYRQTGKLPPNMGRGTQGQFQSQAIRTRAVEQEVNAGGDPSNWPGRWQGFATHAAGLRVLENRAANMTLIEEETKTLIPRVREASKKVSRSDYPDLNRIILAAKEKTGDQDVIKFGIAAESLIPVYARLLKPTGTIGVTDTENARHILNKAWSDGQIDAALDQMEVERTAAKQALDEARKEFGLVGGKGGAKNETEPAPKVIKWEKGPDGILRPAP